MIIETEINMCYLEFPKTVNVTRVENNKIVDEITAKVGLQVLLNCQSSEISTNNSAPCSNINNNLPWQIKKQHFLKSSGHVQMESQG